MDIIIEYQYFAPSILFKTLCFKTYLIFEQYEAFQKRSFRNRCVVAGGNGPVVLSIPLRKGRNQKTFTRDVEIDNDSSWQIHHWRTIVSCYSRSAWFEFYRDELEELYRTSFTLLCDWNRTCFEWVVEKLEFPLSVSLTDKWNKVYDSGTAEDWRNKLLPNSIDALFPEAFGYRQVFEDQTGFIPNLSILDLLFCEGKNARDILCRT